MDRRETKKLLTSSLTQTSDRKNKMIVDSYISMKVKSPLDPTAMTGGSKKREKKTLCRVK